MRGGLTFVAGPTRPRYVYVRGVSPLWLARVRRLLTEHANEIGGSIAPMGLDLRGWPVDVRDEDVLEISTALRPERNRS
jgi:hypothetical protein